jgi:2',3'-cyclic-nucleotide 2'-phosphodiesterase/3'-nucleotidase
VKPDKPNLAAKIANYLKFDVETFGNHDIETGHDIFDLFVRNCNFPILGANAINLETEQPYFEPYTMLYRSGVKIAVIGFITPAIPHWVPTRMWEGMRFEDIRESAQKWIPFVKEQENPDFIIGLLLILRAFGVHLTGDWVAVALNVITIVAGALLFVDGLLMLIAKKK